jgi:DNA-binding NtrC family response regulator
MPSSSERTNLKKIVRGNDWTITTASTAVRASEIVRKKPPTVVICGEKFSGGDWRQFLSEIHSSGGTPPTIVAAQHADERLWADVLNRGGFDLLQTPFEEQEVRRVLEMACRHGVRRLAQAS